VIRSLRPVSVAAFLALLAVPGNALAQDQPPPTPPAATAPPPSAQQSSAPTSSGGGAAPSSEARAMAETLFFAGRGLMEAGRYPDACQKFGESYRLDPAAGTLLNLAVCHEKEGKIASAWGEFKQALSDAKKAGRPDREQLAQEHITVIEPDLPYLTLHVPPDARVPGLEVVRNGNPLFDGGWGTALPIDPGTVEIVTRAPGYKPKTQTLAIERKERKEMSVEALEKAPVPVVVITDPGWSTRRKVGVGVLAAGVVVAGIGTYFGIRALTSKSDSDEQCPVFDDERRCNSSGASSMSSAQTQAWVANIGIGVGVAAIAAGTYLFITGATTPEKKVVRRVEPFLGGSTTSFSTGLTGVF
jgi:hypothetical protein